MREFNIGDIVVYNNQKTDKKDVLVIISTPLQDARVKACDVKDIKNLSKIYTLALPIEVTINDLMNKLNPLNNKDLIAISSLEKYIKMGKIDLYK